MPRHLFEGDELERISHFAHLYRRGVPLADTAHLVQYTEEYNQIGLDLENAFREFFANPNLDSFASLLYSIVALPELSDQQQKLAVLWHLGYPLGEVAVNLGYKDLSIAKGDLKDMYPILGQRIFWVLECLYTNLASDFD